MSRRNTSARAWDLGRSRVAADTAGVALWSWDVLDRVRAALTATRNIDGAYGIDFRVMHGINVRWISARGRGDDQGIVGRTMYGVFLDVTERK